MTVRPLLLLHGFTGGPASWNPVLLALRPERPVLCPWLLGHGGSDAPLPAASFEAEVDRVASLAIDRGYGGGHLCGYSLGGRVALGLLARHPGLFASATLIGASPGISDPAQRRDRVRQDELWARLLEERGVGAFVERWRSLPLFSSQTDLPERVRSDQRTIRLSHQAEGLARALRVLGTGTMQSHWPSLASLGLPVQLMVGERDEKFLGIAQKMSRSMPDAELLVVPSAGHNVVLERPGEVARLLSRATLVTASG